MSYGLMRLKSTYPFMAASKEAGLGGEKRLWHLARLKAFDKIVSSPHLHFTPFNSIFLLYDKENG
jgi:hypothetical protein